MVIERYPNLLVDISEYWLWSIALKLNICYEKQLKFILGFLEEHFALILGQTSIFKKWLLMLSKVPMKDMDPQIIVSHIYSIIKITNFKKSNLYECLDFFVQERILKPDKVLKQVSYQSKHDCFRLLTSMIIEN